MTPSTSRPPPASRAAYPRYQPLTLRWMDNDVFGHVNNAHYYSFFDTAVCSYLVEQGILYAEGSEHIMVVAESGCRYHAEVAFPEPVELGLRVDRIGTSSVRYGIGVFRQGAETAAADGYFVHVCVGRADRRPAPLPPSWRAALQALLRPEPGSNAQLSTRDDGSWR